MTAHGKRSTYVSGCRCDSCRAANREYERRRYADQASHTAWGKEIKSEYMDASTVRKHVERLLRRGATQRGICVAADVPRSTLHRLMNGSVKTGAQTQKVCRRVGERLLALTAKECRGESCICSGCGAEWTSHMSGFCSACRAIFTTDDTERRRAERAVKRRMQRRTA